MNRTLLALVFLAASTANAALPGDSAKGKTLHQTHCVKCHDTAVYSRSNRNVKSLVSLKEQLGSCSHAAQVLLMDDEQRDIVKYLNEQFYKFR